MLQGVNRLFIEILSLILSKFFIFFMPVSAVISIDTNLSRIAKMSSVLICGAGAGGGGGGGGFKVVAIFAGGRAALFGWIC
jgi:hypothetical protein